MDANKLTLAEMAVEVLTTAEGKAKTDLSLRHAKTWVKSRNEKKTIAIGTAVPPLHPARPQHPQLLSPRDVPKRKPGSVEGRIALLHAVAHIELNAVDLHWDIIARFSDVPLPLGFFDDWVKAASEESKHFKLVSSCLEQMDSYYGALPAHAGMWRAAEDTKSDLLGRLAVVPMVLEARGLDVTPNMIEIFRRAKADEAVAALEIIYREEVSHVAYGSKWFNFLCGRDNLDPKEVFHNLVRKYFKGNLKPPFNEEKRADAGLPPDFYWPLSEELKPAHFS